MFSAQTIMYWSVAVSTIMVFIHIAFSVIQPYNKSKLHTISKEV